MRPMFHVEQYGVQVWENVAKRHSRKGAFKLTVCNYYERPTI